jgi:hypothetical protein
MPKINIQIIHSNNIDRYDLVIQMDLPSLRREIKGCNKILA